MTSNIRPAAGPPEILVALGANMPSPAGTPPETLAAALAALGDARIVVRKVSAFRRTLAWPDPSEPPFTNAVASIETDLQPLALLAVLHRIETAFGRKRSVANAPRTLDLDLLAYGGVVLDSGPLLLPHPRLAQRRFVLEPLVEIAPEWRHPVTGLTSEQMLAAL